MMSQIDFSVDSRVVLCVPHGGINDSFVQIQKCIDYCCKYERDLILDTRRSGLFLDFDRFFTFDFPSSASKLPLIQPYRLFDPRILNQHTVYPSEIKGLVGYTPLAFSTEYQNFVEKKSGVRLTFDPATDYTESILIHEQCGGGTDSFRLLSNILFTPEVSDLIRGRISFLPEVYSAIHVRNSDYKTDYESYFMRILSEIDGDNILICSDDANVKKSAEKYFKNYYLLFTDTLFNAEGRPLHHASNYLNENEKFAATVSAFTDLIALGRSDKLFFSNVILNNQEKSYPSGFSRLAKHLNSNKNMLKKIIGF